MCVWYRDWANIWLLSNQKVLSGIKLTHIGTALCPTHVLLRSHSTSTLRFFLTWKSVVFMVQLWGLTHRPLIQDSCKMWGGPMRSIVGATGRWVHMLVSTHDLERQRSKNQLKSISLEEILAYGSNSSLSVHELWPKGQIWLIPVLYRS